MVRYWQAYNAVKDILTPHPVQRRLSVSRPVVQLRLSVLLITLCLFLVTLTMVVRARLTEPHDPLGRRLHLPSSRLDWMVQAARERPRADDCTSTDSTAAFIARHKDLVYASAVVHDGQLLSRITSPAEKEDESPMSPESKYWE